jgi:thiol-disulfide isomerase/thioredoxin
MKKVPALFIFFSALSSIVHAQQLRDPGWSYVNAPIDGLRDLDSASARWEPMSGKWLAWREVFSRQYRDRGTIFFGKNPSDPHFNEWFLKTVNMNGPEYWKYPSKVVASYAYATTTGVPIDLEIDEQAEAAWLPHYLAFREKYLNDSNTFSKDKEDFLADEIFYKIYRLGHNISLSSGNLDAKLIAAHPAIERLSIDAFDMARKGNTRPLKELLDEFGSHDIPLQTTILSFMKTVQDTFAVRDAEDQEQMLQRLQDKPVELKLESLDGSETIDLAKLRGKAVMIDFWNIHCGSCIGHMPKYERIYKQFRNAGFELVSVCVIGSNGKANQATEKAKALAIQKKMGLTYPVLVLYLVLNSGGSGHEKFNPIMEYFDWPAGGSIYMLDKGGRLITTNERGQWMEFEIRKTLGLPLDKTGKD